MVILAQAMPYCTTGSMQSHHGSSSLVKTLFDERDHASQCAPVVELGARAVPAVVIRRFVRGVILADVPMATPLTEHAAIDTNEKK